VQAEPGQSFIVLMIWTDDVDGDFEKLVAAGVPC
jgi:hypothetical protein